MVSLPVLFFLFATHISNIYLRPALFVVCSWFIAGGFRGEVWQRVFSVSVFQIILILLEIMISYSLQPIEDISLESYYLSINIFMKLGTLGIIIVLFLFSRKRKVIFSHLQTRHVFMLLLFSSMSLFFVSFSEYLLLILDHPDLYPIGCIGILLCIFVNINLYYIFYQLSAGEEAKTRLQFINFHLYKQKEQQNYVDSTYREIRKLSHDLNRYMSAVFSLLEQGKTQEAMQELQKRQLELAQNQLFDTGYPMLNSVLAYKMQSAQKQNIQTQLFWNLKEPLQLNITDLAVILSNGLENAIEAARQVTTTRPFISILAETKKDYIKICISNTIAVSPVIVEGKIATTKKDKKMHGLGLESIQELARRYDGNSYLNCKEDIFTLTIILKNMPGTTEE